MSDNVISVGFMAVLKKPVGNHHTSAWGIEQDRLYAVNNDVQLNYDGDVVYFVKKQEESYAFDMQIGTPGTREEFLAVIQQTGLEVIEDTIRPFFAHWYNGADSPMSEIKAEALQ